LKKIFLIILIFFNGKLFAYENYLAGSRFSAMSGCGVSIPDIWSVSYNQAGLAFIEKPTVGVYHENRFLMKELGINAFTGILPVKPGTFGFSYNYFGFSLYHEAKFGLSFGKKLGKNFAAGLQLDYFSSYTAGSDIHSPKLTFELGLLSFPIDNLAIGVHVFNPIPGSADIGKDILLPSSFELGLAYTLQNKIILAAESEKDFSGELILKFGIEYLPVSQLAFRMGISSDPSQYSFGLGYQTKRFWSGLAFNNHLVLGLTPSVEFGMVF
jgi:hypothetical protein